MNALTPVILNSEFWVLWSMRQLLRGIAIGIGLASALVTLSLFALVGGLGTLMDLLKERSRLNRFSPESTKQAALTRGPKEVLS